MSRVFQHWILTVSSDRMRYSRFEYEKSLDYISEDRKIHQVNVCFLRINWNPERCSNSSNVILYDIANIEYTVGNTTYLTYVRFRGNSR